MKNKLENINEPQLISAKKPWTPHRWAVIGASGFVGKSIVERLKLAGFDVLEISAPRVFFDLDKDDPVHEILTDSEKSTAVDVLAVQFKNIEVVINAAGVADPGGRGNNAIYGANSLLPVIIAKATDRANVGRLIHLSSAAVQGRRKCLDATPAVFPFSHYSYSKALGERALLSSLSTLSQVDVCIIRATSVQGLGRSTTEKLQRIARSRLSSVAYPGTQPSVVSSVTGLSEFAKVVGENSEEMAVIQLQPWEGLNVLDVMLLAGQRKPILLPRALCKLFVGAGYLVGRILPSISGITRRVEMTWFGQGQSFTKHQIPYSPDPSQIKSILRNGGV